MSLEVVISIIKSKKPGFFITLARPNIIRQAFNKTFTKDEQIEMLIHAYEPSYISNALKNMAENIPGAGSYISDVADEILSLDRQTYVRLAVNFVLDFFETNKFYDQKDKIVEVFKHFKEELTREELVTITKMHINEFKDEYFKNKSLNGIDILFEATGIRLKIAVPSESKKYESKADDCTFDDTKSKDGVNKWRLGWKIVKESLFVLEFIVIVNIYFKLKNNE